MLYNESTWNNPGSHDVERFSFDSLNLHPVGDQGVASDLGFNEDTWDCWVNHYYWYDWIELEEEALDQYFTILGWNKDMWDDNNGIPVSDSKSYAELTNVEKQAALNVCYTQKLWD